MKEQYIQVGFTAMRGPDGSYLPAVPIYIKAEEGAEESEEKLIKDLANLTAHQIKAYKDGCRKAGVPI